MPRIPLTPYVRGAVSEGLSANEAFRRYQAAARQASAETGERYTAGRRTVFLQIYSETQAARERIGAALTAPKDIPGGGLKPLRRDTISARGVGNWASIFHRPVGSSDVQRFYYLAKSQTPLTPAEVEALARADFEDAAQDAHGSAYNSVVESVIWTGVEEYNPGGQS